MERHDTTVETNRETWEAYYSSSPRMANPDLTYLHLLHRYAMKHPPLRKGLCIGSGDGPEAFAAARAGIAMTCLDISQHAVDRLNGFSRADGLADRVSARMGEQTDLSAFPDGSFDLAVSWSVASYLTLSDAARAVAEIRRVLRPGGSFIGLIESTESTGFYQDGAVQVEGRTYRMPEGSRTVRSGVVITFYTEQDLRRLLSGFAQLNLAHSCIALPPRMEHRVARWMFHAVKE
jgi:SAM-dependent methyltransferase